MYKQIFNTMVEDIIDEPRVTNKYTVIQNELQKLTDERTAEHIMDHIRDLALLSSAQAAQVGFVQGIKMAKV